MEGGQGGQVAKPVVLAKLPGGHRLHPTLPLALANLPWAQGVQVEVG